jgi:hypothetical protein
MSTHALGLEYVSPPVRGEVDVLAARLAGPRARRVLAGLAALLAAAVLLGALVRGYELSRPVPDATFAFRV